MIKTGDIVLHTLSKLYFICENTKQARWMNENKFYKLAPADIILSPEYFYKQIGKH